MERRPREYGVFRVHSQPRRSEWKWVVKTPEEYFYCPTKKFADFIWNTYVAWGWRAAQQEYEDLLV